MNVRRRTMSVFVVAVVAVVGSLLATGTAEAHDRDHRVHANFSVSPHPPIAGQPVTFTDTTQGTHEVVLWIALGGHPTVSTSPTFVTTFDRSGLRLVALIVKGPEGFDFKLRMVFVKAGAVVPDLAGQTRDQARETLRGTGLVLGHQTAAVPSSLPAGEIVDTSPAAGSTVAKGSKIDYRVSSGVVVTTFASGVDGPGLIVSDHAGNVYVAVANNTRIEKFSSGGAGSLVPGTFFSLTALGVDQADHLFAADGLQVTIVQVDPTTGAQTFAGGFPGGSPNAHSLYGVTYDFGFSPTGLLNWVMLGGNAHNGQFASSVPGDVNQTIEQPAGLDMPVSLAIDSSGTRYVAQHNAIYRFSGGVLTLVVGSASGTAGSTGDGGQGTAALLNNPTNIRFDGAGNLYIADAGNQRVRRWSPTTGRIETVLGGPGSTVQLAPDQPDVDVRDHRPHLSVAFDPAGNLLVADPGNGRILEAQVSSPAI